MPFLALVHVHVHVHVHVLVNVLEMSGFVPMYNEMGNHMSSRVIGV